MNPTYLEIIHSQISYLEECDRNGWVVKKQLVICNAISTLSRMLKEESEMMYLYLDNKNITKSEIQYMHKLNNDNK